MRTPVEKVAALARGCGVKLATVAVCPGHAAPAEFLAQQVLERPPISLWQGPRGGGKSFVSGLGCWLNSQRHDDHGTRILGGSKAQSAQIYEALRHFGRARGDRSPLRTFTKTAATFNTGSEVSILAASPTAVRGPHVPELRLDEVDEIPEDLRESAMGMCMEIRGVPAAVIMTSTWHKVAGAMAGLMERGLEKGEFPVRSFCMFEVLERCPEERSGRRLEKCPECPIVAWCHQGRDEHPSGLPRAKRSDGHYAIDSLIQKVRSVSARIFESDYLCRRPRAAGVWFTGFDSPNVTADAEYTPGHVLHVAADSGVFTGGVMFQVFEPAAGGVRVNVFADYLSEGQAAEQSALDMLEILAQLCGIGARRRVSTDSAGGSRNPVGPTVLAEYQRVNFTGEKGIECWPSYGGSVQAGLQFLEALVRSADGTISLFVHPRCKSLIRAFENYARAKRAGQWQDYPSDPQHPHEDLMDALRGGLLNLYPDGRKPQPKLRYARPGSIF